MERKKILLRLDPVVHDALTRWAADELRSTNSQIEFLLRRALSEAGRLPDGVGRMRPRGRPKKAPEDGTTDDADHGEEERADGDASEAG
ncbi:hypothetical protein LDL08_42315 [Nonomuraea glycinis]|uniref:Toxin-antitoxin system HicB family antitoxin n=1 Tax=Nonomuraea glycinis TaxID=2047744 RepID=A0A918AE47_9ACTN|nr:hypothetical protein [Nonomuraea glycinis]MCA2182814.1 hypothetical protein [Nonomuraea glycinis]GGP17142.1 hypothetical protein GCM10012278_83760 [Nonomuraea glycinis]